jgi:hypothetical protein
VVLSMVTAERRCTPGPCPRAGHQHPGGQACHCGGSWFADERAEQHQSADVLWMLRGDENRRPCRHGIAHQHRWAAELEHQGLDVAGGRPVPIFGKGMVAVPVTAKVHHGHSIPGGEQRGSQEPEAAAQVTHAGDADDQWAGAADVVGHGTFPSVQ